MVELEEDHVEEIERIVVALGRRGRRATRAEVAVALIEEILNDPALDPAEIVNGILDAHDKCRDLGGGRRE